MWTCPKCGSQVDPSFDVCWNCGTTPEGVEDPTFVKADEAGASESPVDLDMPKGEAPIPEPVAPLAASWPTMFLSSSETISSGVMWDDIAASLEGAVWKKETAASFRCGRAIVPDAVSREWSACPPKT